MIREQKQARFAIPALFAPPVPMCPSLNNVLHRFGALRLLSHVLAGDAEAVCSLVVERRGLPTLFPVLMVTPAVGPALPVCD